MITAERALALLEQATAPLETIEVPLDRVRGHVLAEPVAADRDFPPTDRSAMDGYAVRAEDVSRPGVELKLVGELRAGQAVGDLRVSPGCAARIMTGAIVPPGADAVVMVERTEEPEAGRRVRIDDTARPGQHVRRRAEDVAEGTRILEPGTPIRAAEISALASVGLTTVRVHRRPVVSVLSTGDEIVEPTEQPAEHQVRNSNARGLVAQLAEIGLEGRYLGISGDDRGALERLVEQGFAGDALLVTGGVSAGRYDIVAEVLAAAGMRLLFHKVSVKPGKPLLAGVRGRTLVAGLPGNPVSTFTTFAVFVAPALRRLAGHRRWRTARQKAALSAPLRAKGGRETYHLARLEPGPEGLTARRLDYAGSGDVLCLARANGFVVTPAEGGDLAAGAIVSALPWPGFDLR